jgi:hypothetical protein
MRARVRSSYRSSLLSSFTAFSSSRLPSHVCRRTKTAGAPHTCAPANLEVPTGGRSGIRWPYRPSA